MGVRIRKAEFQGQEDKFYAPAADIRNCMAPMIKAALDAAFQDHEATQSQMKQVVEGLAAFYEGAYTGEDKLPALESKLAGALNCPYGKKFLVELAFALLRNYVRAQRETVSDPELCQSEVALFTEGAGIMAKLDEADRKTVKKLLKFEELYHPFIDKDKPLGVIKNEQN